MDDYLSTRAPSSSSKTVFQKKFSIYSFFQSKDGDLVCCILQTLLTTTRNLCCITWVLEKAMLLSDSSLDFRTIKTTDKETDWDIFIIWKINSGLVWAAWPYLWKKAWGRLWATFEGGFLCFRGQSCIVVIFLKWLFFQNSLVISSAK